MHVQIETVAELAHEIIRALAHETDGTVMPPWSEAPEWMQKSSLEMVTAMYKDPSLPASHFHDVWMKQRTDAGWKWGPVRNEETKENPAMVPYTDLPPHQRAKDAALKAMVATIKKHCLVTFPYIRPGDTITPVTGEEPAKEEKPKTGSAITGCCQWRE